MKEGSVQSGGVSGMMKGEGYRMKEVGVWEMCVKSKLQLTMPCHIRVPPGRGERRRSVRM